MSRRLSRGREPRKARRPFPPRPPVPSFAPWPRDSRLPSIRVCPQAAAADGCRLAPSSACLESFAEDGFARLEAREAMDGMRRLHRLPRHRLRCATTRLAEPMACRMRGAAVWHARHASSSLPYTRPVCVLFTWQATASTAWTNPSSAARVRRAARPPNASPRTCLPLAAADVRLIACCDSQGCGNNRA